MLPEIHLCFCGDYGNLRSKNIKIYSDLGCWWLALSEISFKRKERNAPKKGISSS
jgi:hypothetical protein